MPDAAKLMAALGLAVLAFILSGMVMELFEEDTNFGWFVYVNVVIGVVVGWITVGRRAGRGWVSAINVGFTGGFLLVFWALFIQACNEMVDRAMKNRYDNAGEAIIAVFELGAEFAVFIATVRIALTVVIGGVLTGLLTEYVWQRYR